MVQHSVNSTDPLNREIVNWSNVLTSVIPATNQHVHYTRGKIAVTTNKEYNEILTYSPVDCIPRLNEKWN